MGQTVAVKLEAGIVYVTGTVNGVGTAWQKYQGAVWRTTVPRSETGAYEIVLTGWDELDRATTYRTTLRYGFAAVTGRRAGSYYNAEDLNRVGHAVRFLADLLRGYGYSAAVNTRTNWGMGDLPTAEDMAVYLGNVRALLDCYCILPTTPKPPASIQKLGYQGANAIEQILVDMYFLIENMAAAFYYSGEIYCGEC